MVLPATSASCTALRLAVLALWRSASSSLMLRLSAMSFHLDRQSRRHEQNAVGNRRDALVEAAGLVAKTPRQRIVGHDAETNLVGHHEPWAARPCQHLHKPVAFGSSDRARPAYGWSARASGNRPVCGLPASALSNASANNSGASMVCHPSPRRDLVLRDALAHLVIICLRRGDIGPRRGQCGDKPFGVRALARARTAEEKGQARQAGLAAPMSRQASGYAARRPVRRARPRRSGW